MDLSNLHKMIVTSVVVFYILKKNVNVVPQASDMVTDDTSPSHSYLGVLKLGSLLPQMTWTRPSLSVSVSAYSVVVLLV